MTVPDGGPSGREEGLDEILGAYYEAVEAGEAPLPADWIARHPEHAPELERFFAEQDRLHRLATPLRGEPGDPVPGEKARYFGDYELLDEIARGGMGVVYRARQISLNRPVAVKLLLPERDGSQSALARFRNEAEAIANLDHPHIVPIHEVGVHRGRVYFSMKLFDGGSLADRLGGFTADPELAARLVAKIARAVHHAHRRGILHRDVKPSNILLDGAGEPHLGDFGLAKRFDAEADLTLSGEVVGSPAYMAPEQTSGSRGGATVSVDVYGLGAVLYALLTGRPPFRGDSVVETLEAVRRDEPASPAGINPRVRPDLQAICLKALEKSPEARYADALALADDLDRFLAGEPTAARPPGRARRWIRWAVRRRRPLAWTAAGLLAVGLSMIGVELSRRLDGSRRAVLARDQEIRRREEISRRERYTTQIRLADQLIRTGEARRARAVMTELRPAPGEEDLRGFEWRYLVGLLHQERRSWTPGDGVTYHVAFSPDGRTIATSGVGGVGRLWDADSLALRASLKGHVWDVNSIEFATDGRTIVTAGDDATLRFWNPSGDQIGESLPALGTPPPKHERAWALHATFARDGRRLFSFGMDGRLRVWDVASRRETAVIQAPLPLNCLALDPDGSTLAVYRGGTVEWHDVKSKELDATAAPPPTNFGDVRLESAAVFSPDGRTSAITLAHEILLWDKAERAPRGKLLGHYAVVRALAFSPDGRILASGDDDGAVRLWEFPSGSPIRILHGHEGRVWGMAFSPDGATLATSAADRTVKLWDVSRRKDRIGLRGLAEHVSAVAFRDDSTLVAADNFGRTLEWNVRTGQAGASSPATVSQAEAPAWECGTKLLDRARFAATLHPGSIRIKALTGERRVVELPGGTFERRPSAEGPSLIASPPDGSTFVTRLPGGGLLRREATAPDRIGRPFGPGSAIPQCLSPTGEILVAETDADGRTTISLLDPDGSRIATVEPPPGLMPPQWCVFSSDGRTLAQPCYDGRVLLMDARTLAVRAVVGGHAVRVHNLAFSPDGKTLATGSLDSVVRLWDVRSGLETLALEGHRGEAGPIAFSPDGRALAAAGGDSNVLVWFADGEELAVAP